jgi:hypothetical protein
VMQNRKATVALVIALTNGVERHPRRQLAFMAGERRS